ncbi:hypothetical protein [Bosea sp. (in: a-proteobacteria)]|uniref:hypothetical protein n=1 Tax=Bosea sp. (in: a-proteobacteria) TaxID=1871050 RepID=UPI003B3BE62F
MSATMAARARNGASLSAPVRRPQQQPARRRSTPWIARVLRAAAQSPGRALIYLAFGAASVAILANALMFQSARHPHPIMTAPQSEAARAPAAPRRAETLPASEAPAAASAPAQPGVAPVLPPSRPSALTQTERQPQGERQPERQVQPERQAAPRPPAAVPAAARNPAPAPAPAPVAAASRPAQPRDPIADLINGDLRPPADIGRAPAQRRASTN